MGGSIARNNSTTLPFGCINSYWSPAKVLPNPTCNLRNALCVFRGVFSFIASRKYVVDQNPPLVRLGEETRALWINRKSCFIYKRTYYFESIWKQFSAMGEELFQVSMQFHYWLCTRRQHFHRMNKTSGNFLLHSSLSFITDPLHCDIYASFTILFRNSITEFTFSK